jgi:dinuclear metal center YbgI/SA1388 family protein
MTAQWIIDVMEEWAPLNWAMESDNVGLMVGDRSRSVSRVLTALDLSEEVLREAVKGRFDFIITHHPLFTRHIQPINSITADTTLGKKLMTLIGNGIGLYSAHTNLDVAEGGVNDILFNMLALTNKEGLLLLNENNPPIGLIGYLQEAVSLQDLAKFVGAVLKYGNVRYVGRSELPITKVGLCGGNGTNPLFLKAALAKGCDVYITGDLTYHMSMDMQESGMALIDGTHYATEIPIAEAIAERIRRAAASKGYHIVVEKAEADGQTFKII